MKRFRTTAMMLTLFAAPFALVACSSDSSSDTTVAAETTAESASDTSASADTTAAADSTLVAAATSADSSATANTTIAAGGSGSTAAGTSDTAAAGAGPLTNEQVKGAFQAMGLVSTDAEITCVQKEGGALDITADQPPAAFIKALMVCAPDSMAKAAAGSIDASLTKAGVTTAKVTCFMKSTFSIVGRKDLDTVQKLFALPNLKDFPTDVKNEILADAKGCGLTEGQIAALMAA